MQLKRYLFHLDQICQPIVVFEDKRHLTSEGIPLNTTSKPQMARIRQSCKLCPNFIADYLSTTQASIKWHKKTLQQHVEEHHPERIHEWRSLAVRRWTGKNIPMSQANAGKSLPHAATFAHLYCRPTDVKKRIKQHPGTR